MSGAEPEDYMVEAIRKELARTLPVMQQWGARWTSIDEVLDWWIRLFRLTDGGEDQKATTKPMQCGKCGRRLGYAYACAPNGIPQATPVTENHVLLPVRAPTGKGRGAVPAMESDRARDRYKVFCHRKCGAAYVVSDESLLKAFVITGERGRANIIVGKGPHAAAQGGADL